MYDARRSASRQPRVPRFEGNERLEFTPDEQRAIEFAERAMGNRPQPRIVVPPPPRPRSGLATVIALIAAYLLLSGFLASVLNGIRPQASVRQPDVRTTAELQPETQSPEPLNGRYPVFAQE